MNNSDGLDNNDHERSRRAVRLDMMGVKLDQAQVAPAEESRYGGYDLEPAEASGILLELVPQGARVLDVGCGDGTMSKMLQDHRGARVVGLEPNPERAAVAASRGLIVHQTMLTPSLTNQVGKFDVVLFADVLEHIPNPSAALDAARSMLNPGGQVVASVPNVAHWSVRLNLARGRFDYTQTGIMDSTHLRWFTRDSFQKLFQGSHYEILSAHASAGVWIWDYAGRVPWRWLKRPGRDHLVKWASRSMPTLFGYQHIVSARPLDYPSTPDIPDEA